MKSDELSRRERQLMDVLYRLGEGSAAEVHAATPNPPTPTTVRTMLGILADKGMVRYKVEGKKFIYEPVVPRDDMARAVLDNALTTFFQGSVERVVANLLSREDVNVSDDELDAIAALIEQARKEGR